MAEPLDLPELYEAPEWPEHGWRWHTSRTGRSLARVENYGQAKRIADALGPATGGVGQVTAVVDGQDSAAFARVVGRGCRRQGRFVVHASPRYSRPARAQSEVLRALGKHWDWAAQGGTATLPLLARVWLRAERARDLIVLRADQVHGAALAWLVATAVTEGVRLWLITTNPLPRLHDTANGTVRESRPAEALAALAEGTDGRDVGACECEDLSHPPPGPSATGLAAVAGDPAATVRRIRLLYDLEAAALAAAAAILGCRTRTLWLLTTRTAD